MVLRCAEGWTIVAPTAKIAMTGGTRIDLDQEMSLLMP